MPPRGMNLNEAIDFLRSKIERLEAEKAEQAEHGNPTVVKRLAKQIRDTRTMLDNCLHDREELEAEGSG